MGLSILAKYKLIYTLWTSRIYIYILWVLFIYIIYFFINSKFEGQKILATTNNKWVGIDDHPMIADNREFEKMFEKNDQVNFVVLEDRTPQPRLGGRTAMLGKLHLVYHCHWNLNLNVMCCIFCTGISLSIE